MNKKWDRARLRVRSKIKWEICADVQNVLWGKANVVQIQISSSLLSSHNQKSTLPLHENHFCVFSPSSINSINLFWALHQRFKLIINNTSVVPKDDDKSHWVCAWCGFDLNYICLFTSLVKNIFLKIFNIKSCSFFIAHWRIFQDSLLPVRIQKYLSDCYMLSLRVLFFS